jgi:hypothetical protein
MKNQERIRRKEIQVCTRRKNAPDTLPSGLRPRPSLPPTPPPWSVSPKDSDIDLNIDMTNVLTKINVHVPLTVIMKIPSIGDKVGIFLNVQEESEAPPTFLYYCKLIILNQLETNMNLFSFPSQ